MPQLLTGDCLQIMPTLPSGSVHLVLCDLPYGTTQCKWDAIIPFDPMWKQYKRLLTPGGCVVLHAAQPFTAALLMSNPDWFKYDWVWRKPKGTGHLNAKKQPLRDKEDILVFCKGTPCYNPQMSRGAPYKAKPGGNARKIGKGDDDCYGEYAAVREDNSGFRYPKQILDFPVVERNKLHPTQKPMGLIEYLLLTHSNYGDTVLDNCMGSGTTGVACLNTGRRFIGIENDPAMAATAAHRILTHNAKVTGSPALSASPRGLPGYATEVKR